MANMQSDMDWANIVDIFAHEYGWTIDEIKKLNFGQVVILLKAIRARYKKSEESVENNKSPESNVNKELSIADFKSMGGKERIREDGRKEIIL